MSSVNSGQTLLLGSITQVALGIAAAIITCLGAFIAAIIIGEFPFAIWIGIFIVVWIITFVAIRKRLYNLLAAFILTMMTAALVSAVFFSSEPNLPKAADDETLSMPDSPK